MPALSHLGNHSKVIVDAHGCPACPHSCQGPAIIGSADVFVNTMPALRVGHTGTHAACCGPNMWTASHGSGTVFINGAKAVRVGDQTQHCGGVGQMIQGSGTVNAGG
jgi:uncharacterized Zn-binding protein involved in type VI secretion